MIGLELQGAKKLQKKLDRLEKKTAKKIVRKAVTKGGAVLRKAGRSNARSMVGGNMGGLISKNIVSQTHKRQKRGSHARWVGMRPGVDEFVHIAKGQSKYKNKKTYIPTAIEYGHDNAAAIPFLRSAKDTHGDRAKQKIINEIDSGIQQEAKK
jgi:HK97 gp10 family phage protein